jgi:probable HAF family extracellular repeat protein
MHAKGVHGPKSTFTALNAINDAGVAVGSWDDETTGTRHAFAYDQHDQITDLNPVLGASWAIASDINNQGVIVGGADFSGDGSWEKQHGFIYDPNKPDVVDIGTLPGTSSSAARAVNDFGAVVGTSTDWYHETRPFIYANGTLEELTGGQGSAADINNKGTVLAAQYAGPTGQALLWRSGSIELLPIGAIGYELNDSDQVVGELWPGGAASENAFFYDGQMTLLDTLIPGAYGLHLWRATCINDRGHIVAESGPGGGLDLLLTPDTRALQGGRIFEHVVRILYGVVQDGGGKVRVGNKPVPVDPWGWLDDKQIDHVVRISEEAVDELEDDPELRSQTREQIKQIAERLKARR